MPQCVLHYVSKGGFWSVSWTTFLQLQNRYLILSWWRHQMEPFPRYWPFVRGIHRSPVNSPHEGRWYGALMFSLIWVWTNGWLNNRDAGDLRRHHAHYNVTVKSAFMHLSIVQKETKQSIKITFKKSFWLLRAIFGICCPRLVKELYS